jgi:hypothetical protein
MYKKYMEKGIRKIRKEMKVLTFIQKRKKKEGSC